MTDLRLALFDVDGTLVDSRADILGAMAAAFAEIGLPVPSREIVLSIVGLSLSEALACLAPDQTPEALARMERSYRDAYFDQRRGLGVTPLYPGMGDLLRRLSQDDSLLLGIATGKSRRGLTALLDQHGLAQLFVTTQSADDHPGKPNPSMVLTALAETGVDARNAVVIGDSHHDIKMARAAGVASIGVAWGYQPSHSLRQATVVVRDVAGLADAIATELRGSA